MYYEASHNGLYKIAVKTASQQTPDETGQKPKREREREQEKEMHGSSNGRPVSVEKFKSVTANTAQ
jgi:hypothetical protein